MKKHIRISTLGVDGYESSVANQDLLQELQIREGLTVGNRATMIEFKPKASCVVKVNGYTSTIPALAEYQVQGEWIESFITVTADVEVYLTATF